MGPDTYDLVSLLRDAYVDLTGPQVEELIAFFLAVRGGAGADAGARQSSTTEVAFMAAYVIGRVQVRDSSWVATYGPKTGELVTKHGGKFISRRGKMERLEGKESLPSVMVVIEFPSMEKARSWYHSPEYAPALALRQSCATSLLLLAEGLPEPWVPAPPAAGGGA